VPKVIEQKPVARKSGKGLIDGIISVSKVPDVGIKAIFYGETGTGRTTCATTFPKPLLIIRSEEVESGIKSVKNVVGVEATPVLTSDEQLLDVVEYQQKTGKYKTLVLDSVTFYQDLILKRVLKLDDVPVGFTFAMASQSQWGLVGMELKERLRELLRLAQDGTHVVLTAAQRLINDKEDSIVQPSMVAALTPSAVGWLNVVCNCVAAFRKMKTYEETTKKVAGKDLVTKQEKTSYVMMTGPDDFWITKLTRLNGKLVPLPQHIIDPNYDKIVKLIDG
jgi:hypothetical protein